MKKKCIHKYSQGIDEKTGLESCLKCGELKPQNASWVEKLDRILDKNVYHAEDDLQEQLVSHIGNVLSSQRAELLKEVEGMLEDENIRYISYVSTSNARARNQLRSELRSKLKGLKG